MISLQTATLLCRLNLLWLCYAQRMKTEIPVKIQVSNLTSDEVFMEELAENDADLMLALYSDEFAAQSTLLRPALVSIEEATEWLRKFLATKSYKIFSHESKEPVGIVGLMTDTSGSLHFYISIKPEYRRKGFATATLQLLFTEVFSNDGIGEIGAWMNLKFINRLSKTYEYWKFHPGLAFTLAKMVSSDEAAPMGYYQLEKRDFTQSFPVKSQPRVKRL